ncbi:hypothetical protein BCR33DRAFT_720369 [Rhizoclosmatium globosum]|uniref:Xylanolytic transcriptional activator regulatory domain-containing protein n=1 Tax=Rhizoclosmatium globosum TaxID=329046 RepID=A0A1Y2BWI6_9FUNG|nr:hypothetical protein BCR33DRAFT_720369 [Rhizoclosmatium globosum]|eukprot:ORY39130.1 hypothetical protein BCR33DRAFT_720369 [Rhizoclosmatium globosum]
MSSALTLDSVLAAMEAPLQGATIQKTDNPDFMGTIDDWNICHRSFLNPSGSSSARAFDAEDFLTHFFQQPPSLRLSLCAFAALYDQNQHLIEGTADDYAVRARKAVIQEVLDGNLSYKTVQACTAIARYAIWKGTPAISVQFMDLSFKLIRDLRLNVDPDDSPWLASLSLTPRQREERRRIFWETDDHSESDIACELMKRPNQIIDPHPIFKNFVARVWECNVLRLIAKIKHCYSTPPASVQELLSSDYTSSLHEIFDALHTSVPVGFVLTSKNPGFLTQEEESRFVSKVALADDVIPALSLNLFASISLYHRPVMMLSSLRSFNPLFLDPGALHQIYKSTSECINSAPRITSLFSFTVKMHKTAPLNVRHLYDIINGSYPAFEAMIVIWFCQCRMDPFWWNFLPHQITDLQGLRQRLGIMIEYVIEMNEFEGGTGASSPILQCMTLMLKDMDAIYLMDTTRALHSIETEFSLQVSSIDGETCNVESNSFMGLLGLDVCGIRWKGLSDDIWRQFYFT